MTSAADFGDRGVLVTCADRAERWAVREVLERALPDLRVREGFLSVLVVAPSPYRGLRAEVLAALDRVEPLVRVSLTSTVDIEIEVRYDGIDLDDAAKLLGLTSRELASAHSMQSWLVDVMGFAPGFGYLVPIGEHVADWSGLARRDRPREFVPGGSVAIAAGMSAVYPATMPGGWHLIGSTQVRMFDVHALPRPSLLVPGARVHFREARG